ncbi:hypothetical protein RIF29_14541 [Crotalaria pallida]|uniref:Uncharacterized protein n=1 Tax=Crotalaria pallida TaxID=3830 RepID=A0AAN9IDV1_CROPI
MSPLKLILIFLSTTLVDFFVLKNIKSQPHVEDDDEASAAIPQTNSDSSNASSTGNSKVRAVLKSGFWTFVDMAMLESGFFFKL